MYKFDFPAIGRMFARFYGRNHDAIEKGLVYIIGSVATGMVSKKLDIPVNVEFGSNVAKITDMDDWRHSDSPQYAAIKALADSAENSYYQSEKISAIRSIRSVALSTNEDWASSYAIKALQRIANSTYNGSAKTEIAKVIGELGKGAIPNG